MDQLSDKVVDGKREPVLDLVSLMKLANKHSVDISFRPSEHPEQDGFITVHDYTVKPPTKTGHRFTLEILTTIPQELVDRQIRNMVAQLVAKRPKNTNQS